MDIQKWEIDILRELAKQIATCAETDRNREKITAWTALNDLDAAARPLFMTHLWQISTPEIFKENTYRCQSPLAREFELYLNQRLYFANVLDDDNVIEPVVYYKAVKKLIPFPQLTYITHKKDESSQGSYEFIPTITSPKDIDKLGDPVLEYDREATKHNLELAQDIFEPILTVIRTPDAFAAKVVDEFSWMRGMSESYVDMIDDPEWMEEALQRITNNFLKRFLLMEEAGLWGTADPSEPLGSAGLRYVSGIRSWRDVENPATYSPRLSESWGFTCAELLTCCSPGMHEQFSYQYDRQLMSLFKYMNVGCCEVLDKKMPLVRSLPNVRKVAVSEWCSPELAAEGIGRDYVYSYRAAGVPFVGDPWDQATAEQEIRRVLTATRSNNCPLEIILNIGGTFGAGDSRKKAKEWTEMTRGLVREIYG